MSEEENVYGIDLDGDGTIDAVAVDTTGDGNPDTILVDTTGDGEADTAVIDIDRDGEPDVVMDLTEDDSADEYYDAEDLEDALLQMMEAGVPELEAMRQILESLGIENPYTKEAEPVFLDTTGDGQADTVLVDTTGDGKLDTALVDVDGDGTIDAAIPLDE